MLGARDSGACPLWMKDAMGFLSLILNVLARRVGLSDSGATASLPGPGTYSIEVVGESHHQSTLEAICGGRTEEGHWMEVTATLVHEDANPHDSNAVRVEIDGRKVGYLSSANARQYRKKLKEAGYPGITAACSAVIVGGWDRGDGDRGHFGVKLDLPTGG